MRPCLLNCILAAACLGGCAGTETDKTSTEPTATTLIAATTNVGGCPDPVGCDNSGPGGVNTSAEGNPNLIPNAADTTDADTDAGAGPSGGTGNGDLPAGTGGTSHGGSTSLGGAPSDGGGGAGGARASAGSGGGRLGPGGASNEGGASQGGETGGEDECAQGPAPDPSLLEMCSGDETLTCVFDGNPGHYDVSFLLGGDSEGSATITAESRRFMYPPVNTTVGASRCVSFTVNVRQPEGQPIQDVSPGTPGLNFRLGPNAQVRAIGVRPAVDPVVVYIAGDSTVCDQDPQLGAPPTERYSGWGQLLPQYFGPGVSITNYADSGESTAAFRPDGGGLWSRIADQMGGGDYLFIQLGHNDKTTPAATYASRIRAMVQHAKSVGATPVLLSPIARNTGGTLEQQHIYGDLVVRNELASIAQAEQVAYIDLTAKTFAWMQELGRTSAQTYFVLSDRTHTNELGADVFAKMVVEGLIEENVAVTAFLR